MRLSAKILKNVNNVNSWIYTTQTYMSEGQVNELYIQIVDLDQSVLPNEKSKAFPEYPIRYISNATVLGVQAVFPSIDDDQEYVIDGVQPFSYDRSIWKFTLLSTQTPKSGNIRILLTEDGVTKTLSAKNAIAVESLETGMC